MSLSVLLLYLNNIDSIAFSRSSFMNVKTTVSSSKLRLIQTK